MAYLNIIDLAIKALEDNLVSAKKRDLQTASIRADFRILNEKIGGRIYENSNK